MPQMFHSLSDVDAYVRQQVGDGKGMLRFQLAMDIFGEQSALYAEKWLAKEDARDAAEALERRDKEHRELRSREVHAVEAQAAAAREATRIAWLALGVSAVGAAIAVGALIK